MPSGVLGQSVPTLTYPKQLNKIADTGCRAFTAVRPKRSIPTRRMAPKAQAAPSAVKEDGAKFPSTAGQGSQRELIQSLMHNLDFPNYRRSFAAAQ